MTIKVKIRTLAIAMVTFLLVIAAVYAAMPDFLYKLKKYDALLQLFPNSDKVAEALYWSVQDMQPESLENDVLFLFPDSSSYGGSGRVDGTQAIIRLERLVNEYPDYRLAPMARQQLALLYFKTEQWDKARALFGKIAAEANDEWPRKEAESYMEIIDSRNSRLHDGRRLAVTGRVTIGERPAANVFVVLHRKDDNGWYSLPFGRYPIALTDENGVYRLYDTDAADYEIGVGLPPSRLDGYYRSGLQTGEVTVGTDRTATMDIRFVPQVKVLEPVDKPVITGSKLRLSWEPYPDAAYYKINIVAVEYGKDGRKASTSSIALDEKWVENRAEYDIEALRTYPRGVSKSWSSDSYWLSSIGILGAVYPGGDFIWSVDAYNATDVKISSSSGYYTAIDNQIPFFSVSGEHLLEGDKLVLQGDYEGAKQAYEKQPNQPYALRSLSLLWMNGTNKDDNGDPAKALHYLQQIPNPTKFDSELVKLAEEKLGGGK